MAPPSFGRRWYGATGNGWVASLRHALRRVIGAAPVKEAGKTPLAKRMEAMRAAGQPLPSLNEALIAKKPENRTMGGGTSGSKGASPSHHLIHNVQHVLLVSSGKGGVGKSTIAANLAMTMREMGISVGILDADVYGPSIPRLFHLSGQCGLSPEGHFLPLMNYGVPVMSMQSLLPSDAAPVVWRGFMHQKALRQLLFQVAWPPLTLLIVDMPPGTGDAHLALGEYLTGYFDGGSGKALIVTTPQRLATADTEKGILTYEKLHIPMVGLVENMTTVLCSHCGEASDVLGSKSGHVAALAERTGLPILAQLPLDAALTEASDAGLPLIMQTATSASGNRMKALYRSLADRVLAAYPSIQGPAT